LAGATFAHARIAIEGQFGAGAECPRRQRGVGRARSFVLHRLFDRRGSVFEASGVVKTAYESGDVLF
jgi:hypothetical protein